MADRRTIEGHPGCFLIFSGYVIGENSVYFAVLVWLFVENCVLTCNVMAIKIAICTRMFVPERIAITRVRLSEKNNGE